MVNHTEAPLSNIAKRQERHHRADGSCFEIFLMCHIQIQESDSPIRSPPDY